jgi:hypothetical protein
MLLIVQIKGSVLRKIEQDYIKPYMLLVELSDYWRWINFNLLYKYCICSRIIYL